jgi:mannosyl-oligosaccharide alpha-1,2-mannosidase
MDGVACFAPAMLALGGVALGDAAQLAWAEDLAETCVAMGAATRTGLAPEISDFSNSGADVRPKQGAAHNLLRPEVAESLFVLHRLTRRPRYREWGWQLLGAFDRHCRLPGGGYSGVKDVAGSRGAADDVDGGGDGDDVRVAHDGRMESFWLAETLKYLWLLFADEAALPLDEYVLNTEAHPLRIFADHGDEMGAHEASTC